MTEKHFCYQCEKLTSKDLLTGDEVDFGQGCCNPRTGHYCYPKLLQPVDKVKSFEVQPCPYFKKRTAEEISAIEKWMDKNGITAFIRSMA